MHQPFEMYDPSLAERDESDFPPEQEGITWEWINELIEAAKDEDDDCPF